MKLFLPTTLFILGMLSATAQSISKQVIATSGNTTMNATHQLTSTIGEPIIGLKGSTVSISQGFLAGTTDATVLSVDELVVNQNVKVYPNPVVDFVHINLANNTEQVTAIIYSITGKQVAFQKFNTPELTLNLSHLANGMYLVQLNFRDTNTTKSFKIIKK